MTPAMANGGPRTRKHGPGLTGPFQRVEGKKKANFSIDEKLLSLLKEKAEREGRTVSGALEQAIARWLNENRDREGSD